jgi:hypothetical protein
MAKRDKLNRWTESDRISLATLRADIPYWVTLLDKERQFLSGWEQKQFFLRNARSRKKFRDFVRSLA